MTHFLWALGGAIGGAVALHFAQKKGFKFHSPSLAVLSKPPVPPGAALITPARAAIHGELMATCNDPKKLRKAATLFGHEGLVFHAEGLMRKAQMLHDMMHGAQEIVERCRQGDQHAMALAKGIGEQARAGNKRSQLSAFFIEEYANSHPENKTA
jgi:hypothetical protein